VGRAVTGRTRHKETCVNRRDVGGAIATGRSGEDRKICCGRHTHVARGSASLVQCLIGSERTLSGAIQPLLVQPLLCSGTLYQALLVRAVSLRAQVGIGTGTACHDRRIRREGTFSANVFGVIGDESNRLGQIAMCGIDAHGLPLVAAE
jgi:hypothetical protein